MAGIRMSETALEYQKDVLETIIDEAVYMGTASEEEAEQLHDRLDELESMQSVNQLWYDLSQEYDVIEQT